MKEKNNKIIKMGFGAIFGIIILFAYNIFVTKKTPIINHWLDFITLILIGVIILALGIKYLFEEIL